jgi:hypothetical protein
MSESEPKKVTWWCYWRENIETARGKFDKISWLITIVFFVAGKVFRSINPASPILKSISDESLGRICNWIGVGVGLWTLFWLPFRRHRAEQEKFTAEKLTLEMTRADEKKRLETMMESLRKPSAPTLEIAIIHPADLDILTSKKTYRIKVKNTHPNKTIKNLKVWICDIEWPKSVEKPLIWSGIIFPYPLPKKESQDNSLAHELAAGLDMEFDLMFVNTGKSFSKRIINLAPFRPKNLGSPSQFKSVVSDTSFNIEILPKDDSKLFFKFKITGGDGDVDTITESYILNVPLLLPENSVDNQVANLNSLSHNFDKYLPSFEKTKKPLEKTAAQLLKEKEAVAKLTEIGENIARRISRIKGIPPDKYNQDKDDDTWDVIHAAAAYFVLNLPEAAWVFDEGIGEINTYTVRQPGVGSTIHQDRHTEVLAKLNRRILNLKRIVDEIDKFLKTD